MVTRKRVICSGSNWKTWAELTVDKDEGLMSIDTWTEWDQHEPDSGICLSVKHVLLEGLQEWLQLVYKFIGPGCSLALTVREMLKEEGWTR